MIWQRLCDGIRPSGLSQMEENRLSRVILSTPGVLGFHHLRTKSQGDVLHVAFHLEVRKGLPVYMEQAVSDAVAFSLQHRYGPCDAAIRVEAR